MKSNRYTILAIVALCFAAPSSAYEPLSDEEAREYVRRFPDAAAQDVQRLDAIEHAEPTVDVPSFDVVVTDSQVIIRPRSPLTVEAASVGWSITLPEQRAPYEPASRRWWPVVAVSGAVGFALGVLAVSALQ
jgi:hypothetical protein